MRRRGRLLLLAELWLAATALRAPTARDVIEAADLSSLSISPDGQSLIVRVERASIEQNRVALDWWLIATGTGAARRLGDGGTAIFNHAGMLEPERPVWSPDSGALFVRAAREEGVQVERIDMRTGVRTTITSDPADVESIALSDDGGRLIYRAGASRADIERAELREYRDGVLVDGRVDMSLPLFRGGRVNGRPASLRFEGEWFTRVGLLSDAPRRVIAVDLRSGAVAEFPSDGEPAERDGAALSRRGDRASIRSDRSGTGLEVVLRTGERPSCPALACGAGRLHWASWLPDSTGLVIASRDGEGLAQLVRWDPRSGRTQRILRFDGTIDGGSDGEPCGMTARHAFCVIAAATLPPALERIDLVTGARVRLFDPNAAFRESVTINADTLRWRDADGRSFTGVFYPAAGGPGPLLVNYYSCRGFLRGGTGDEWPFAVLAANGIASLCINKLPGYPEPIQSYRYAQGAIEAIHARLLREGRIRGDGIGLSGLSFASEVTMWMARRTDLVRAASIASVQAEPGYYWYNAVRGRTQPETLRSLFGLGSPDETPERWRELSPALEAGRIVAPVLMQLPAHEARWTMELYAKLSRSCTPVELFAFPDEPHIKTQPQHRAAVYERNVDWFRFWLLGVEDPAPHKAAQFGRWRALRERAASTDCTQSSTLANRSSR